MQAPGITAKNASIAPLSRFVIVARFALSCTLHCLGRSSITGCRKCKHVPEADQPLIET